MSNAKLPPKKTISYQKVISTRNPFSNITAHCQRALTALRAHTLFPGNAKHLEKKMNSYDCKRGKD